MTDIATLGLEVKSDGVVTASDRLKQLTAEGGKAEQATGKLSSSFSNLEKYVQAAQAAFAAAGIGMFVKSSIDAALQIERMTKLFNAATGSANLAARELEYVRGVTNKLGLDLVSTTESYGKFMAAIKGSTLEGERGRKVFESVSGATTALGLRADETAGVFKALEQMMSKGKVQAEELRGQLGERLPGAFKMAADAMGISTAQLDKNLALGKVMAEDLLPALAVQLEKTYGKAALEGANSAQAAINRMNNEMLQTKATIGAALIPAFTDALTALRPFLEMVQQIIGGLQIMSIKAAGMFDRMTANSGGNTMEERIANIAAYRARSKAAEEEAIADLMKRYTPTGSDYTAAEQMRQAGNKPVAALADGKGAEAAKKWASTYEQLRKEIDLLNPSMTELDRKILDVTQKYADLERKKGANIEKLRQLKAEHVEAIRTQYEIAEAIKATSKEFQEYFRIVGDESAWSQTAESVDDYHKKFRESVEDMDAATKAARDVANGIYDIERAFAEAGQSTAIETFINNLFKLKDVQNATTDINISMAESDPAAQQMAAIEERYRREAELIQQKLDALEAANLTETAMYQALSDNILAMASKREKDIADIQRKQSEEGWQAVVGAAQKAFPKLTGLDKVVTAAYKDHTKYRLATEQERAAGAQKLVKDETRSNLSMYSSYAGAAGAVFEGLADTQDQSSRDGFETAKSYNIAAAVMSTASGMMAQLSGPDGWSPTAWARAAIVGITGAINVAQIASTSFGGGGSVSSAPSGSFAAAGGSSSSGTGLSNLKTPLMNIEDTRTAETYERMIASSDSVVEAIGRLSKSLDDLTAIFEEGGAGYTLATNAPQTALTVGGTQKSPFGTSALIGSLGNALGVNGVESFFKTVGTLGIADIVESMFASENKITESGMALAVQNGMVTASQMLRRETGSWWSGSKTHYEYTSDPELQAYMQSVIDPFIADIKNMAITLGTTVDFSKFSSDLTNIQVAGKTTEEVAKQLEDWTLETLQGLALTVEGLAGDGGVIGNYDDAYAALKRLNDGIVTLKDSFLLIGKTVVEGTLANAQAADALITSMGGIDDFNEAIDTYFTSMFTDAEQDAARTAEANRTVKLAFLDMQSTIETLAKSAPEQWEQIWTKIDDTTYLNTLKEIPNVFDDLLANGGIPKTREEFRDLVNSLDVTTDSGAATFAALMNVSEAFGTVMSAADDAAAKLREIEQATEDLNIRYLKATGSSTAADDLERQLSAQREIEQAITDGMGDAYIARLREVLNAEKITVANDAAIDAAKAATDAASASVNNAMAILKNSITAAKAQAQDAYNAQIASIDAQKKALDDSYAAQIATATKASSAISNLAGSLQNLLDSLSTPLDETLISRQVAQAELKQWIASGNLPANGELDGAIKVLGQDSKPLFSSFEDYATDFYKTAIDISTLNVRAQGQLTTEEQILQQLKDSQAIADKQFDEQKLAAKAALDASNTQLDATLKQYQDQLDAINGTTIAVMSVEDAIKNLAGALESLAGAKAGSLAAAVGGGSTPGVNGVPDTAGKIFYDGAGNSYESQQALDLSNAFWQGSGYTTGTNLDRAKAEEQAAAARALYSAYQGSEFGTTNLFTASATALESNGMAAVSVPSQTELNDLLSKATSLGVTTEIIAGVLGRDTKLVDQMFSSFESVGLKVPGFAVGTNFVPADMFAQIHQGERIIPAADNYALMKRLDAPASNAELVEEIKALREELRAGHGAIATNTSKTTKVLEKWNVIGMPAQEAA